MIQDEEEVTHDSEVEQQEETVEVEETETEEETLEAKLARAEAEANKFRRLYEKSTKPKPVTTEAPKDQATPNSGFTIDDYLTDKGVPEELWADLKSVAALKRVSPIKALNDPIFVAVKEKFEKDKRREEASVPASRGAGSVRAKKDFTTPGLTREEHIALIKSMS
jgi:3-methyladenine DNA glycosylase AlkC